MKIEPKKTASASSTSPASSASGRPLIARRYGGRHHCARCRGSPGCPARDPAAEARGVSAKSLLESRVVASGGEVVVRARLLAERREQLDGPPQVAECLGAGVARERRQASVVVMEARVVRRVLEPLVDRLQPV